ncbi:MAG TPA: hypothetical protein VFE62_29295 [Gemmataceae bacterium]|nr:hypothetical protein [Gemmataceae bacterium]
MYKGVRFLLLPAFAVACLWTASFDVQAQGKKGKGAKGPSPGAEILTVRGTVREFTTAPKGEKDGVMLTDGTWVHWPPHLENRFANIIDKGDKVKVVGWMETDKKGETKLEVSSLTNLTTNQTRETEFGPAALEAREKFGAGDGEFITANGSVKEFTTAKKGETDGFILNDGRWVHWPPHMEDRFANAVVKGDKVRVTGYWETGKKGETKLEVSTLTNLRTNKTIENPDRPASATELRNPVPGKAIDRDARIRELEDQVQQLLREVQRLRKEK